ncbi:unnamed protein product [Staurois parvus]|uniref:Uncharacterized protein n=1 Tax=Staurois parvus TaxID=386267 RepID=A0ABN9BUE7_9NEOB|nr:unnamed protein product [Staurois parvus]
MSCQSAPVWSSGFPLHAGEQTVAKCIKSGCNVFFRPRLLFNLSLLLGGGRQRTK